MIKLYGSTRSSAGRCHVMLEECGLKYEALKLDMANKQNKSREYLTLNPNGKVPTLIDGDFVIWESIAINRYLAEKYKPELLGSTIEERALIEQWSVWSLVEFQPDLVTMLIQMVFVPEARRDHLIIEKANARVLEKFEILNTHMRNREFVVANYFSLADLNSASVANIGLGLGMNLGDYPHMMDWLMRMKARKSFKTVAERG
ncbi:MAG: hypothetical protein A4S09_02620 [Proteobacteria bacterium SG_bin7]|nr:MAG: hypothetical protein A4S09_02620 [Proteobacteria bacterium SG_bin7]